jgi:hypothetical protein
VLLDERPVRRHQAAEVLRPGPVHHAVHHHVPDLLRPEFLCHGRKGHEGIDLALDEERHRLGLGMRDPGDLLPGVQADIGRHAGQEDVVTAFPVAHGDGLPLQVADGTDPLRPDQHEAADVHPSQEEGLVARLGLDDEGTDEGHA